MIKQLSAVSPLSVLALFAFGSGLAASCTSNQDQFSNSVEIESAEGNGKAVEAQAQQGSSAQVEGGYSLEWFSCTRNVKAPYIVMLNRKDAPFAADTCKAGLVQSFLQQDFNVLAVNRPGAGKSEGKEIMGDDQTLKSFQALIKDQTESGKTLSGLWGYEDASVLAFRAARPSAFQFLIIGSGIYDWEALLTESKDPAFVSELKDLQKGQDSTFSENRSVAWDYSGLPKNVYLYHVEKDAKYPESQAEAFRSALAANQYNVQLIKLRSENGALTPVVHQSVLIQIALGCTQETQNKISRSVQNWTGTNGVLDVISEGKLMYRFINIDKMTTADATGGGDSRAYRFGYGVLDANMNYIADPNEKKLYFEISDYSTSYVFYENPL